MKKQRTVPRPITVILLTICLFCAFLGGYCVGLIDTGSPLHSVIPQWGVNALPSDFRLLGDVWQVIQKRYVGQPVDTTNAVYGTIRGLIQSLNDPYTVFFTPEESRQFEEEIQGTFEGIGAEIGIKENNLVIIAPLPDSPAARAGLVAGDRILSIDTVESATLTLEEAVQRIRGEQGTTVTLKILSEEDAEPRDVAVTRESITVQSVTYSAIDDSLALIELSYFGPNTAREFQSAANKASVAGLRGILLDLRNNPGGYLDAAVDVASTFLRNGEVVVIEEEANGTRTTLRAEADGALLGVPLVVLVDQGSASGSEIVAGALQDHGVATIVGSQTFGKGTVQQVEDLPDGSSVKVTIARWLTPNGRSIQENGVTPNTVIEPEGAQQAEDVQKQKAIEVLRDRIEKKTETTL